MLRTARERAGLTLRALAVRAHTSHSTLAAYEAGRVTPSVDTLDRIVRAAGFDLGPDLTRRIGEDEDRGRELVEVLDLAAAFPSRHAATLTFPVFGRA